MRFHRICICAVFLALSAIPALGQEPRPEALLAAARTYFNEFRYREALETLAEAEALLQPLAREDEAAQSRYLEALSIRGRIHVIQQDLDAARAAFRALLEANPDYGLPGPARSTPSQVFEEVKRGLVGELEIVAEPGDATVLLGDRPLSRLGVHALVAGHYLARVERIGYESRKMEVSVAAGQRQRLEVRLTRRSPVARLVTSPPGVELLVNGELRGVTQPSALAAGADQADGGPWSAPFPIVDFRPTDVLTLRRECYESRQHSFDQVTELRDYEFSVQLQRAEGVIAVDGPAGAELAIDGVSRGVLPVSPLTLCAGDHRVEVRGGAGRFLETLQLGRGATRRVVALLRPSFALLHHVEKDGYVGPDARTELTRVFSPVEIGLSVPAPDEVRTVMEASPLKLEEGFLAYDLYRKPVSAAAKAPTPSALREESLRLSLALGAQGVAEIRLAPDAGPDRRKFLLSLLAAGSGAPDVLEIDLNRTESIARAAAALDSFPSLRRPSLGLSLADVPELGTVVSQVERGSAAFAAGIVPGDFLTSLDEHPVPDAAAVSAWLATRASGHAVTATILDRVGRKRVVTLELQDAPRLIAASDESWRFNALITRLRSILSTREDPVARLHLAVALIAVRNHEAALSELAQVNLPEGSGVSGGTVKFLQAECFAQLGRLVDARLALQAALQSESLLTDEGPAVRELAEQRLAALGGGSSLP